MYIPPAANAVNFTLKTYTAPSISSVNFELGGAIAAFGQVLVSGVWKVVSAMQVTVSGAWKPVTKAQVCVGESWKELV